MQVRDARTEEHPFILDSWVKSYAASDMARLVTPPPMWPKASDEYWRGQRAVASTLLGRAGARVVEADGLIAGWACLEPGVVHYVYVRLIDRGNGVARALLADALDKPAIYTHRSRGLDGARVPKAWRFDPYWLMT